MRFKEFGNIEEAIPAVLQKDLKAVGPNILQATQNLTKQMTGKLAAAVGKGKPPANDPSAPTLAQGPATQLSPTAVQQAQAQAASKNTKPPEIPAIGSQLVLPDKDTKKPASYTIKSMRGNDISLTPVGAKPSEPKVDVTVKKTDLQKALSTLQGQKK